MQKLVRDYLNELKRKQKKRKRVGTAVVLLVILVIGTVIGGLTQAGVAMTGNAKCGIEEHEHSDGCYEDVLACGQEEGEGHQHGEGCYTTETRLSCGMDETEGHQHDESCYDEAGNLICGTEEAAGHQHDDSCYTTEEVLTCEQEEGEGHIHSDACYEKELACKKEEHTHTEECYIDKKADVEDSSKWDEQYKDTEWKETWAENLVIAAEAQIGYKESEDNYEVAEDGSHKGYTRYGQFMDDVYADWDAAFVNFCMHYAGKDDINIEASEVFPKETEAVKWYEEFTKADEKNMSYLVAPQGYKPKAGELVFFDRKDETPAFQMGIVSSYDEEKNEIKVIEGNSDNEVKENEYGIRDEDIEENHIFGYLKMDEVEEAYKASKKTDTEENDQKAEEDQKDEDETSGDPAEAGQEDAEKPEETEETEEVKPEEIQKVYTSEKFTVTASYSKEANIPEEAEFKAEEVAAEGNEEHYAEREAEFKKAMGDEKASMKALLKVGFYVDGEEVEPESPVTLTIQFLDENGLKEGSPITVVHFAEKGTEVLDGGKAKDNSATFQMGSFSEIAIGEGMEGAEVGETRPINKSFKYEDEMFRINFHVVGNAVLTEDVIEGEMKEASEAEIVIDKEEGNEEEAKKYQFKVQILDRDTEEYIAFSDYANGIDDGHEQFLLQVMKYSLFYEGLKLDLTDCKIKAEITPIKTLEGYVGNATGEETAEEDSTEQSDSSVEEKTETEDEAETSIFDSVGSTKLENASKNENVLGNTAQDLTKTNGGLFEEDSPESKEVVFSAYVMEDGQISMQNSVAVGADEKSPAPVMTIDLEADATFAAEGGNTANPKFTVQYFANLELVAYNDNSLKVTTSGANTNELPVIDTDGGKLPRNGTGKDTTPNDNKIRTLYVDTATGKLKTKEKLTEVYTSRDFEYYKAPTINYMNALVENPNYELKEIRVMNPVCNKTSHTHTQECHDKDGTLKCKEEEHTHSTGCYKDQNVVGNWDSIAYSKQVHFTNRALGEGEGIEDNTFIEIKGETYIVIKDGAMLRLVYNTTEKDKDFGAAFYDYDIGDGKIYSSQANAQNKTNGKDTSSQGTETWYMHTGQSGINDPNNYGNSGTKLAFGNANTGSGLQHEKWNGNLLNKHNTTQPGQPTVQDSYKGCTFGLATGLSDGKIQYSEGVNVPKLFNDGTAIGKTPYDENQFPLTFNRVGDTHTLKAVKDTNAQGLDSFNNPKTGNTTYFHIWTNNFWPMDSADSYGTDGHDMKFGNHENTSKYNFAGQAGAEGGKAAANGQFPPSDDGLDHNSYFGMHYQVEFDLKKDYIGPLEYYFFGDDDMWVFLDNQLVCDIGGVHSSVGEYVNLWDYLAKGSEGKHTLSFFYTERGESGSTCWMQFTLPSVSSLTPEKTDKEYGQLKIQKTVEKIEDGKEEIYENEKNEFEFKIELKAKDGSELLDDYSYTRFDKNGKEIESNLVLHHGSYFKLKNGEYIIVKFLPEGTQYTITEKTGSVYCGEIAYVYDTDVSVDGGNAESSNTITGDIIKGTTSEVAYTNKFTIYKLPSTGGTGIYLYMFGGVLLMAGAMLITYRNKRREVLRS